MNEFNEWYDEYSYWAEIDETGLPLQISKDSWFASLKWYQAVADKCEQDCNTDEDYKILYFHLKQVLKNELKN